MLDPNIIAHQIAQELALIRFECEQSGDDYAARVRTELAEAEASFAAMADDPPASDNRTGQVLYQLLKQRCESYAAALRKLGEMVEA